MRTFLHIATAATLVCTASLSYASVPLPKPKPGAAVPQTEVGLASKATAALQKKFTLEGFFAGTTIGRGTLFSKTVGAGRSFRLTTQGTWDGKKLTLVETYQYSATPPEQRLWTFTKVGDGVYRAVSKEILKPAKLEIKGRKALMKYQKNLPRPGGKPPIKVSIKEEWSFDRKGVLTSRSTYSKVFRVGREAINFVREENEAALRAPGF